MQRHNQKTFLRLESTSQCYPMLGRRWAIVYNAGPTFTQHIHPALGECLVFVGYMRVCGDEIIYTYGIVGKAIWAHLSTSHHIKPEPLDEGLL